MYKELIDRLPEKSACLQLIDSFEKLLQKYARMLRYDDAYNDMLLFFVETINHMRKNVSINCKNDGAIVKYIVVSLKHHYMVLLKKQSLRKEINFSDFNSEQLFMLENSVHFQLSSCFSDYFPLDNPLTEWEKQVLVLFYECGYQCSEIAKMTKKSRQAVNQAKHRALRKIANALLDTG